MSLRSDIAVLYQTWGERHILPFMGGAYDSDSEIFRTMAIGINAYVADENWPENSAELRDWYTGWWASAGRSRSRRFFEVAYEESAQLAASLQASSLFCSTPYQDEPNAKAGFYGTNAIKYFMTQQFKDSGQVSEDEIAESARTWHGELDLLAKHGRLPHLVVVFGRKVWHAVWQALNLNARHSFPKYEHLDVLVYSPFPEQSSFLYHHVNRVTITIRGGQHEMVLVRLQHPRARKRRRNAEWLLAEPSFRRFVGLGP